MKHIGKQPSTLARAYVCAQAASLLESALDSGDDWLDEHADQSDAALRRVRKEATKLAAKLRKESARLFAETQP